jgi:hypothetical protein
LSTVSQRGVNKRLHTVKESINVNNPYQVLSEKQQREQKELVCVAPVKEAIPVYYKETHPEKQVTFAQILKEHNTEVKKEAREQPVVEKVEKKRDLKFVSNCFQWPLGKCTYGDSCRFHHLGSKRQIHPCPMFGACYSIFCDKDHKNVRVEQNSNRKVETQKKMQDNKMSTTEFRSQMVLRNADGSIAEENKPLIESKEACHNGPQMSIGNNVNSIGWCQSRTNEMCCTRIWGGIYVQLHVVEEPRYWTDLDNRVFKDNKNLNDENKEENRLNLHTKGYKVKRTDFPTTLVLKHNDDGRVKGWDDEKLTFYLRNKDNSIVKLEKMLSEAKHIGWDSLFFVIDSVKEPIDTPNLRSSMSIEGDKVSVFTYKSLEDFEKGNVKFDTFKVDRFHTKEDRETSMGQRLVRKAYGSGSTVPGNCAAPVFNCHGHVVGFHNATTTNETVFLCITNEMCTKASGSSLSNL